MSETGSPLGTGGDPLNRPQRTSRFRLAVEFALFFAVALVLKQLLVGGMNGPYPNPLWLPVIVLSLQHGLAAGLAATIIATGLQFSGGLPPALMTEDMYSYIGRVAAEPVSWACVALLIGHIRSQQIAQVDQLQSELAERIAHGTAVADLCVDLRGRTELLERHIAASAHSSNVDIAEAMRELHDSTWDDFAERLTRFIILMTGTADFSVYLLRDNVLKVVFQPNDEHTPAGDVTVSPEDPLFMAVVTERRTVSARRPAEREMLGNRGVLLGPLFDNDASNQVIGMFAIGGNALDDHPEDMERRFSLASMEVSRLLGRITLNERWHAAAAPGQSNGHLNPDEFAPEAAPENGEQGLAPSEGAHERPGREVTLQ